MTGMPAYLLSLYCKNERPGQGRAGTRSGCGGGFREYPSRSRAPVITSAPSSARRRTPPCQSVRHTGMPCPTKVSITPFPTARQREVRRVETTTALGWTARRSSPLLELADLDVTALDADPERLTRVTETLQRLGLQARTVAADASQPARWWDGQPFDAILLDAPCSASGIVRRHPDVRWLRRDTDIAALARTQDAILQALWPLLKPGGHLLYCTCSVFKMEGQDRIDAFLQRTPDAQARPAPGHLLPVVEYLDPTHQDRGDGFFYALLTKAPTGS